MRVRLIRRRRSPNFWQIQRRSFLFGWEYVDTFGTFELAMQGARDLLRGDHPDDIIEIVAVREEGA